MLKGTAPTDGTCRPAANAEFRTEGQFFNSLLGLTPWLKTSCAPPRWQSKSGLTCATHPVSGAVCQPPSPETNHRRPHTAGPKPTGPAAVDSRNHGNSYQRTGTRLLFGGQTDKSPEPRQSDHTGQSDLYPLGTERLRQDHTAAMHRGAGDARRRRNRNR